MPLNWRSIFASAVIIAGWIAPAGVEHNNRVTLRSLPDHPTPLFTPSPIQNWSELWDQGCMEGISKTAAEMPQSPDDRTPEVFAGTNTTGNVTIRPCMGFFTNGTRENITFAGIFSCVDYLLAAPIDAGITPTALTELAAPVLRELTRPLVYYLLVLALGFIILLSLFWSQVRFTFRPVLVHLSAAWLGLRSLFESAWRHTVSGWHWILLTIDEARDNSALRGQVEQLQKQLKGEKKRVIERDIALSLTTSKAEDFENELDQQREYARQNNAAFRLATQEIANLQKQLTRGQDRVKEQENALTEARIQITRLQGSEARYRGLMVNFLNAMYYNASDSLQLPALTRVLPVMAIAERALEGNASLTSFHHYRKPNDAHMLQKCATESLQQEATQDSKDEVIALFRQNLEVITVDHQRLLTRSDRQTKDNLTLRARIVDYEDDINNLQHESRRLQDDVKRLQSENEAQDRGAGVVSHEDKKQVQANHTLQEIHIKQAQGVEEKKQIRANHTLQQIRIKNAQDLEATVKRLKKEILSYTEQLTSQQISIDQYTIDKSRLEAEVEKANKEQDDFKRSSKDISQRLEEKLHIATHERDQLKKAAEGESQRMEAASQGLKSELEKFTEECKRLKKDNDGDRQRFEDASQVLKDELAELRAKYDHLRAAEVRESQYRDRVAVPQHLVVLPTITNTAATAGDVLGSTTNGHPATASEPIDDEMIDRIDEQPLHLATSSSNDAVAASVPYAAAPLAIGVAPAASTNDEEMTDAELQSQTGLPIGNDNAVASSTVPAPNHRAALATAPRQVSLATAPRTLSEAKRKPNFYELALPGKPYVPPQTHAHTLSHTYTPDPSTPYNPPRPSNGPPSKPAFSPVHLPPSTLTPAPPAQLTPPAPTNNSLLRAPIQAPSSVPPATVFPFDPSAVTPETIPGLGLLSTTAHWRPGPSLGVPVETRRIIRPKKVRNHGTGGGPKPTVYWEGEDDPNLWLSDDETDVQDGKGGCSTAPDVQTTDEDSTAQDSKTTGQGIV